MSRITIGFKGLALRGVFCVLCIAHKNHHSGKPLSLSVRPRREIMSSLIVLPSWLLFIVLTGTLFGSKYLPFDIGYILAVTIIFGWILLLGISLSKRCKAPAVPLIRLKLAIGYAWAYAIAGWLYFMYSMPGYIIPFHILAMFCVFYSFLFIAKSLVQAEKENGVENKCKFCVVLMVWFFPIGVWFLQPRVKRAMRVNQA